MCSASAGTLLASAEPRAVSHAIVAFPTHAVAADWAHFFSCPILTVPHSPAAAEVAQLVEFVSPPVLAVLNEQYFITWTVLTAVNTPVVVCSVGKPLWRPSLRSCCAGRDWG